MALTKSNQQLPLSPVICAEAILTAQAAVLGSTTIFPSAPPGIYKMDVVLIVTTGGASGNLVVNAIVTDDLQAETIAGATIANLSSTGQANAVVVFENTATANINYSITAGGTFGSCVYNAYIILERLF